MNFFYTGVVRRGRLAQRTLSLSLSLSLSRAGFKALLLARTMYRQWEIPWNISPLLDIETEREKERETKVFREKESKRKREKERERETSPLTSKNRGGK